MPRNKRHYRVRLVEVVAAHDEALREFGGRPGILQRDRLEAAVARPYNGYYRTIEQKVAALVQSLACDHGFVDGNKRTALFMLNLLLRRSGYRLRAKSKAKLNRDVEAMILALVRHRMSYDEVVAWLKERTVAID